MCSSDLFPSHDTPRIIIPKHILPEKTKKPFYPQDMINGAYNKMAKQQKMEIVPYTKPQEPMEVVQYVPQGLEVQNVPQIPDNPPFNPLTIIKNSINAVTGVVQPIMEGISTVTNIPQLSTVGGAMEYGITKLVDYINPIPMEIENKVVNRPQITYPTPKEVQYYMNPPNQKPIQVKNVQPIQIEAPQQTNIVTGKQIGRAHV